MDSRKHRANKVVGPDGWLYPEGTTFSDTPRHPSEIANDENLSLAALGNQLHAERDEADPYAMTQDKLEARMGKPRPLYEWADEDDELLVRERMKNLRRGG